MYRNLWLILWGVLKLATAEQETLYLIPKNQRNCLPANRQGHAAFRVSQEELWLRRPYKRDDGTDAYTDILSFPGCFELKAKVEKVRETGDKVLMYHAFKWLQAPSDEDISDLDVGCTGADEYGCGGEGNKCIYCDVCKALNERNQQLARDERVKYECPKELKLYDYQETRCVKDWGSLDKDKNGKPDFLEEQKYKGFANLLDQMKIEGYGSMRLKVKLSTDANGRQRRAMKKHKETLETTLRLKGQAHRLERDWKTVYRLHWLPRLLSENEVACVEVTFDICSGKPDEDYHNFRCIDKKRKR